MRPSHVLAMPSVEYEFCRKMVMDEGYAPGDFLLQQICSKVLEFLYGTATPKGKQLTKWQEITPWLERAIPKAAKRFRKKKSTKDTALSLVRDNG